MENKFVLITGASSGMGEATSILLAKSGYKVFAGVRSEKAISQLNNLRISNLHLIKLDVTNQQDIENAFEVISKKIGSDGLMAIINNAGNNYSAPTEYFDETAARNLVDTHFWGMASISRAFIPLLRVYAKSNPNKARIINVGSVGSISAFPFIQFYNAAKFAILGFTESIRFELEPFGVKAIAILPGSVKTEIWKKTENSVTNTISSLSEEALMSYEHNIIAASRVSSSLEGSGISSQKAALIFKKALEASNPKFKYFIGIDAIAVNFMVKYLPDSLRHSIVRLQLKFKKVNGK